MTTATVGTLNERAMLVDLTIRRWAARKNDHAITQEVADTHGNDVKMGRYRKELLPADALEEIRSISSQARDEHHRRTLPWFDDGARVLSSTGYLEYTAAMRVIQARWDAAVEKFLDNYEAHMERAKIRLNGLFRAEEYPSRQQLALKFHFSYVVMPLPAATDFRVGLADVEVQRIQESIEQATKNAMINAMSDVRERVTDVVGHLAERLREYAVDANGKVSNPFRDSIVENVRKLIDLLPSLNLSASVDLDTTMQRMQDDLCAFTPETLRSDEQAREKVAAAAEDILAKMSDFI